MKRVLCLVDLNDISKAAAEYAANISKCLNAELVLLHVLRLPTLQEAAVVGLGYPDSTQEGENEADQKLLNYRIVIEDQFQIPCRSIVRTETINLNKGVEKEIEKFDYEAIVMGTNGAENFQQFLFGVHSERLAKHVKVPLIIVPENYVFKEQRQIVYASDYEKEDVAVVKKIMKLIAGFNPQITVLHVSKEPSDISNIVHCSIKNELEDELDNSKIHCERIFDKEIVSGIHGFMIKEEKDLLVLLAKNYSLGEKFLSKGVFQQINVISSYPVMVIHSSEKVEPIRIIPPDVVF